MSAVRFPLSFHDYPSNRDIEGTVSVSVNWPALVKRIGKKAALNKTRKSRALNGAITVVFNPTRKPCKETTPAT